jgi:hypothetical protein
MGTGRRVVRPSTTPEACQFRTIDNSQKAAAAAAQPREAQPALRTVL